MKTFRDLLIWQKAMTLVTNCYTISSNFPKKEQFGLISQIRRCSISIPSNISEDYGRGTNKDYHRFLTISLGSLFEFQTQIEITYNLNIFQKKTLIPYTKTAETQTNLKFIHKQSKSYFVTLLL